DRGQDERVELTRLKQQIKDTVGKAWLKEVDRLPAADQPKVNSQKAAEAVVLKRWDLRQDNKWYADGDGVKQGATRAGEFSIALDGDKVLSHVHSSGVFTDLISTKDR